MRHVVEMTFAGSVGLIAVFLVDFLSLFYISMLRDEQLTAGVGYATTVLFFAISVNVGLMIAVSALTARALGAGDRNQARRVATSGLVLCAIAGVATAALMLLGLPKLLGMLGAEGAPYDVATRFLWIVLPSNPLMALGMALSGILRGVGDARRAMLVTLIGGLATAVLDPLFIFIFKLGTDGAALATVMSRVVFCIIGWQGVATHHNLVVRPTTADVRQFSPALMGIAVPAILTNIASPVAQAFILSVVRRFGHEAVTAGAIIDRLVPLAFGVIFALSASVGPILAQNLGAGRYDRLRRAMRDALVFAMAYCCIVWLVLALGRNNIAQLFGASEKTASYVAFFCLIGAAMWIFNGLMFVANAAFNNLGYPLYSTVFNWGRATIGTMPFALYGAQWGYEGVLIALIAGWAIFGVASVIVAFRAIRNLERKALQAS
jgi:putative MATE family efflux protein